MTIEKIKKTIEECERACDRILQEYGIRFNLKQIKMRILEQYKESKARTGESRADKELVLEQSRLSRLVRNSTYENPIVWIMFKARMAEVNGSSGEEIIDTLPKLRVHSTLTGDPKIDDRGCAGKLRFVDIYLESLGSRLEGFADEFGDLRSLWVNEHLIALLTDEDFVQKWGIAQENGWKKELAELDFELEQKKLMATEHARAEAGGSTEQ